MGPFDKAALMEKVRLRLELTPWIDRVQSHIQQVELYISRNLISPDLRGKHSFIVSFFPSRLPDSVPRWGLSAISFVRISAKQ